ncbi:MAG: hypothetical protein QOI57_1505 [Rubrobacteraceae bacterium]|jgi:hypothetical protein|nr:hypothetical protein [Rubrobacteraceae bacterium]
MTQVIEGSGRSTAADAWKAIPTGYSTQDMYRAVSDACYVYQYRDLEHNLRRFSWRQARKRILRHGALSGEWINRGRGELRLRRRGLEVRLDDDSKRLIRWKELQEFIQARRY